MKGSTLEVTEKDQPQSSDQIKGSNIHQEDEQTQVEVENRVFEYLISTENDSTSFSFNVANLNNLNIYEDAAEYKYAICILLKDNSLNNCLLLGNTIKGIIKNLDDLKTIDIEPKDIYIFIFINQIVNHDNLVKNDSIKLITKDKKYLKIPLKLKDKINEEDEDMKIDVICKKYKMTEVESLQCFYNYCVSNLKKEDKPILTSIITAGVSPNEKSLKKLIKICCPSNTRNQSKSINKFSIAVPTIELYESKDKNFFIKVAQYDRAHFNLYNMSFYNSTAAVPISSLLNTMMVDKKLLDDLNNYYKAIFSNSSIDYHDYNLALYLYRTSYIINFYCDEPLGHIQYNIFSYMEYKNNWIDKFSGYYGNFFSILKTFSFCTNIVKNIFMLFQIIGLLIEFIYPSLSIMVIYSIFVEAFNIFDKLPAIFMTLLYLIIYLGSGVCSMISNKSEKIELTNYFFYIFMEVYYLFILICSIPAMDNIKKGKTNKIEETLDLFLGTNYKFNTAACACLIIFTFIIAILPIIFKISVISKNIAQMFIYLFLGAPSSTSNFLIAKIWRAPETSGGNFQEERKGITIIAFFLFNLFFGFLSFYNFNRKKRALCVMGLAIFYLIYLFFKIVAILMTLLCGFKLDTKNDEKVKNTLTTSEKEIYKSKNPLAQSNDNLKSKNDIENENTNDNNNEKENEEQLDKSNNDEENKNEKNENNEEEEKDEENKKDEQNESRKEDDEVENNE